MKIIWKFGLCLSVLAVCFLGCEKKDNEPAETAVVKVESTAPDDAEPGNEIAVNAEGDEGGFSMNIDSEKGTFELNLDKEGVKIVAGEKAAWPADMPSDVPQYPGLKVTMAQEQGNGGFNVQGETTDAVDKVTAYIKEQAVIHGWQEVNSFSASGEQDMQMLTYKKADRTLNLMVVRSDTGSVLNLTLGTG